jgi:hypothetical protein
MLTSFPLQAHRPHNYTYRKRDNRMTIIEKTTYRAATLPEAPERATRAEAEADEVRGVELAAYLALLPGVSDAQWEKVDAARGAVWDAARAAVWAPVRDAARASAWDAAAVRVSAWDADAAWDAVWGAAMALLVRDQITTEHFETLVAPMRAAGIDFDNLTESEDDRG